MKGRSLFLVAIFTYLIAGVVGGITGNLGKINFHR